MHRRLVLTLACLAWPCLLHSTSAQPPESPKPSDSGLFVEVPSDSQLTPEMWFYMQEYRRYKSPKEAVRRKAEQRAAQRENRLAAQRWFGYSNLRPTANPIPYFGTYSPTWASNTWNPAAWSGTGCPYVTFHVAERRD